MYACGGGGCGRVSAIYVLGELFRKLQLFLSSFFLYILLHYLFHVYIFMYFHCGITASCLYECHPDHHVSSNVSTCIANICQSSKMTNISDLVRVLF